ncbi:MAG: TAXI family TRAP transporter solute-binding subunit [Rhodospirillales bacterium]
MVRTLTALATAFGLATAPAVAADIWVFGSNPQGSLSFTSSTALAKVVSDKLGLQVRVQPTAGSSTFIPLLNTNEINFAAINVDEVQTAYNGAVQFEGKPNKNLRLVSINFPLPLGLVVPMDSPAKKIPDIKGMRIPTGYAGMTTARVTQAALLANGGLTPADMKDVPAINQLAGMDFLAAGRVDVASGGIGIAQIQKANAELAARGGVRFLPIDTAPDAVARMQKVLRAQPIWYDPAPGNVGIVERTPVMGYSFFLATNAQVPEDLVYNIVKLVHGSRDALVAITPIFARFDPKRMNEPNDAPYHPGAIKFYNEIGQWPPKE